MPTSTEPSRAALVRSPGGLLGILGDDVSWTGPAEQALDVATALEASRPRRWVWWSASDVAPLVEAGWRVNRCWDLAEVHRLRYGGWAAQSGRVWAAAHGIPLETLPEVPRDDLFGLLVQDDLDVDTLVRPDGHLRADAADGRWTEDPEHLLAWAAAALEAAHLQEAALVEAGPPALATARSESLAALLCVELHRTGLPIDRPRTEELIAQAAGPRPKDEREEAATRRRRDAEVLRHVPGRDGTDLRNPAQVRDLLAAVGVDVPSTRKHVLEPYRSVHPVVDALLTWRKSERIATTYGYRWLDAHVGADDRLRGGWTACDGAAGRMTAENGLHNLPQELRPAVAAAPGHRFVRADLGQIEPRVLAVVSADPAFLAATRADDLYAPVAARLGVERPVAKVAVLAAMYGQRSGAAGEALAGLESAYPVAMGYLDDAYTAGVRGRPIRTFGGRLIPTGQVLGAAGEDPARDAARGRFARNAVIQGAAAELFKAWAATVRATTDDLGASVVLCLHDELLVHVPEQHADEVAQRVLVALEDSARRWSLGAPARFVADVSVLRRWSEAKG